MISFIDELKDFCRERKRAYKQKLLNIGFFVAALLVVCAALSIALSKIVPTLFMIIAGGVGSIWLILKVRRIELSTFISHVKDMILRLLNLLRDKQEELKDLDGDPAQFSLIELLSHANSEEREGLENFSGTKFEDESQFELSVRKKATHDVVAFIKRVKGVDKDLALATYSDMLDLIGNNFKIERESRSDRDFEAHLVQTAFDNMVDAMDEKDRKLLEHEIATYAETHLGKKNLDIALSSGGLLAANLGGFATYTMASSLLAGVGSTLGMTLPFAAYTTLSSALSVALGPIGIGALGLWGLHKITSPNLKVTILVVLSIASIRERLIFEYPQKRRELENEIENILMQREELENFLLRIQEAKTPNEVFAAISAMDLPKSIENRMAGS